VVHKKATLELAIKNYGCPSISIRKTKKEEMVGQVFFFLSSSSSFRFLAFGFPFMSFISGWITLIWSLTTRGQELLIKNYGGYPLISIRKMEKEEMVGQVFFFFLLFSSFLFSSHFIDFYNWLESSHSTPDP
jgi:hypothetical protein